MQWHSVSKIFAGAAAVGDTVEIRGWIRTRRDSKAGLSFLAVHDGSCFDALQVVAQGDLPNYAEIQTLTTGCSVVCRGVLAESQGKGQSIEMQAAEVEVVGLVEDPDTYPVAAKRHTFEYLREVAHLRTRTNTFGAITRVRNCLAQSVHRFFHEDGFQWVHTPIVTASDCEGAGEMFRVSTLDMMNLPRNEEGGVDYSGDFFGREAFLTVSGQLNVETHACALSKVYTFGPTFRAENSNTSRHLAEFWMIEPEVAFNDLTDNMDLAEDCLRFVLTKVLERFPAELEFLAKREADIEKQLPADQRNEMGLIERLRFVTENPFVRITYTEAIDLLRNSKPFKKKKFKYPVEWGIDLQSEHERWLVEKKFKQPVILTDYPAEIKAFYMRANDDGKTVAAMDVLVPGIGELVGGSQREERLDVLKKKCADFDIPDDHVWWYLDTRRFGTAPHAGFGMGFERLVMFATGMTNIRDVIPFPRTPQNAEF